MSLLHVSNLSFRHPLHAHWLLEGAGLDINPRDRIGVVGVNGSGKTTLLRLLTGELAPHAGEVVRKRGLTIAHARQSSTHETQELERYALGADARLAGRHDELRALEQQLHDTDAALRYADALSEFEELGGFGFEARVHQVLAGLGFSPDQHELPVRVLSGGQRTRAELARVLLAPADVVLLDEPTNHLDVASRDWLESYIATLDAAVLAVSHDRRFLRRVAARIVELRRGKATVWNGGYAWYREQRELRECQEWEHYLSHQRRERAARQAAEARMRLARRVTSTPAGVRHGKDFYAAKAAKVERTAKVIMARAQREPAAKKPVVDEPLAPLRFVQGTPPGAIVFDVRDLSMAYGDRVLFTGLTFQVGRDDRIAITGPNGCGKTTLVRVLLGQLEPDAGSVQKGVNVRVGAFAQDAADLDPRASALEACSAVSEDRSWTQTILGCLRVPAARVHRPVGELSPGERAKVGLARVLLAAPNVLVLDEPTNHLDVDSQEAIEDAVAAFDGTLLVVSHDRDLVERVATRTIALPAAGAT